MILSLNETPNPSNFFLTVNDESFIKIALVAGGCLIFFIYWMQKECRRIDFNRVQVVDQFQ